MIPEGWRESRGRARLHFIQLQSKLPVIGIPLSQHEPLLPFDLQPVFRETYDGGPYHRGAVDYSAPPHAPLTDNLQKWASDCITLGRQPAARP